MKNLMMLFLTFILSSCSVAQSGSNAKAQNTSSKEKHQLLVFSGSDWCKPCIQLKQDILSTDAFKSYSEKNLEVLIVDFPYKKKNRLPQDIEQRNKKLAERYNPAGDFPKVILLDQKEQMIGTVAYQKNMQASNFIDQISSLRGSH